MSDEERPQTLGQLKALVLHRVENLIFMAAEHIYEEELGSGLKALDTLRVAFRLLPPDIRRDLKEDEEEIERIKFKELPAIKGADRRQTIALTFQTTNNYLQFMLEITGKMQRLLYERYLVEEYAKAFWDPAKGRKSGEAEHDGFGKRVKARI